MKDCRKQKEIRKSMRAWLPSSTLAHTSSHKSQAGLSLHDRATLLWLNTQEHGMIKVSGASERRRRHDLLLSAQHQTEM